MESSPLLRLIPLLPFVGAAVNLVLGARIQARWGRRPVHLLAVGTVAASFALAVAAFLDLLGQPAGARGLVDHAWTMLEVDPLRVDLSFHLDPLGAVMALVVTGVGGLIHVYSIGYMAEERSYWRFFGYLNLFTFAMLLLVLGDNLFLVFFGWEGVGLCSYLLIGFWYQNRDYARAGMKAFVVNRIGDVGFALGMILLFWGLVDAGAPTLTFREMAARPDLLQELAQVEVLGMSLPTAVCLLFFLGAAGKSAQLPLHVWLPDAMAGPTPVSALIHAATMVTAGVYLVARLSFLYALSEAAMTVVATVGVVTALFAATIGFFQRDVKKVLAYSTVSQLGFMFVGVGVGAFSAGIFHLVTHAFFKAALFLGAGSIILGLHHEQDLMKMGGLRKAMPRTWLAMALACYAIAGFPPFSGFFSKDEILWRAFDSASTAVPGWLIWLTGTVTAGCTAFYMYRLYYLAFSGTPRGEAHAHEAPRVMTAPVLILAGLAAVAGLLGLPHLSALDAWLAPVFASAPVKTHGLPFAMELAFAAGSAGIAAAGFLVARALYKDGRSRKPAELLQRFPGVYRVVFNKYFVDELYDRIAVRPTLALTRGLKWFDDKVIDGAVNGSAAVVRGIAAADGWIDRVLVDGAVNAVSNATLALGRRVRRLQTGRVQHYVLGAATGAVLLLLIRFMV